MWDKDETNKAPLSEARKFRYLQYELQKELKEIKEMIINKPKISAKIEHNER